VCNKIEVLVIEVKEVIEERPSLKRSANTESGIKH
jgi:hypothetical protein